MWFAQPDLTTVTLDTALSCCLLPDSFFIAETNQQAFDGHGEGYFKAIRHKYVALGDCRRIFLRSSFLQGQLLQPKKLPAVCTLSGDRG